LSLLYCGICGAEFAARLFEARAVRTKVESYSMGIKTNSRGHIFRGRHGCIGALLAVLIAVPAAHGQKKSETKTQANSTVAKASTNKKMTLESALLKLSSDKPGYEVSIGKQRIGTTPLPGVWVVKPGKHSVLFKTPKGEVKRVSIDIAAGETKALSWPPQVSQTVDKGSPSRFRWAPWTMSDIGAATATSGFVALAVGGFFGVRSKDLAETASAMNIRRTYRRDFTRLSSQAEDMSLAANISYGVGAVAVIGGLTLAIFGDGGIMAIKGDDDEGAVIIGGEF